MASMLQETRTATTITSGKEIHMVAQSQPPLRVILHGMQSDITTSMESFSTKTTQSLHLQRRTKDIGGVELKASHSTTSSQAQPQILLS